MLAARALLGLQQRAGNAATMWMVAQRAACCGEAPDPAQHAQTPEQQTADITPTIRCDGQGGFYTDLGLYEIDDTCSLNAAVGAHERVHKADWEQHRPDTCKDRSGKPLPTASSPRKPDGTEPEALADYNRFHRWSECRAYDADFRQALELRSALRERDHFTKTRCLPRIDTYLDEIDGTKGGMGRAPYECKDPLPPRPPRGKPG